MSTIKRDNANGCIQVSGIFDEFTGAPVVDSSLVLWLDAAQSESYPGTGTTWTDLTGNGYNGTLTNGPTFSSTNGGAIVFDGNNDYVTRSNVMMLGGQNVNVTVEVVFYLPTGGGGWLITNERESSNQGHGWYWCNTSELFFSQHSTNNVPYEFKCVASSTGFSNVKINNWNIVSFGVSVLTNSMTCNFLINGYREIITNNSLVFAGTQTTTQDNIDIGRLRNHTFGTTYANIRIASIKIYNRLLNQTEQLQNFNALRGRYGI